MFIIYLRLICSTCFFLSFSDRAENILFIPLFNWNKFSLQILENVFYWFHIKQKIFNLGVINWIRLAENQTPICVGNLLDGHRGFQYGKNFETFFESRNQDERRSCRLLYYTDELVVSCLDAFYESRKLSKNLNIEKKLHFVFMGDSRIRQQFFNFIRVR